MIQPLTIVDWLSYDDAQGKPEVLGGMGGWFGVDRDSTELTDVKFRTISHRWKDYVEREFNDPPPHLEVLRSAIVAGTIRHGGFWHQNEGTPLFSDGTVASYTMRAWGDLLAAIWSEHDNQDYTYCDFAWSAKDES